MTAQLWQGVPVVLSRYLTIAGEPVTAPRTWRQRLFSRPWRPWVATYTYTPQVPDPKVVRCGQMFVMHPETWDRLRREFNIPSRYPV